jgi:hypothetical protein
MRHDFVSFMDVVERELAIHYSRIQQRRREDPGTAGDQAEENWATLLKGWLPPTYHVVTKGRLLTATGKASPQVDVLVLRPSYPRQLLDNKHYYADGVVAVFECKLTLAPKHLPKIAANAAKIKRLFPGTSGTPYDELQKPILFGVLAHSHMWPKRRGRHLVSVISDSIDKASLSTVKHPSELLDVVCIADTATFLMGKHLRIAPHIEPEDEQEFRDVDPQGGLTTSFFYDCLDMMPDKKLFAGTVLGTLISQLTRLLAFEDTSLRPLASYFFQAVSAAGVGRITSWSTHFLSPAVVKQLQERGYDDDPWSRWGEHIG